MTTKEKTKVQYTTIALKKETLEDIKNLNINLYWVDISNTSDKITFLMSFYSKHWKVLEKF